MDIHARTHRSLLALLDHLDKLPEDAVRTAGEGFSYPTVIAQLYHVFGAERYWMQVLQGTIHTDDDEAQYDTLASLRVLEADVARATREFLASLSDADARSPRRVTQWNGVSVDITPAHVLLRTQTHAYQHQGEIATLLRQLGHPFPSRLDFPLG